MNGNDFISWVLRSPLHGMLSNGMMLITVIGRKTGKEYTLPVGYYPENGRLWILTSSRPDLVEEFAGRRKCLVTLEAQAGQCLCRTRAGNQIGGSAAS